MIDSIFVALSGMRGHERGLNVISNNVANLNTPGFRGTMLNFTDVFTGLTAGDQQSGQLVGQQGSGGGGLDASRTLLDLRAGTEQHTGRDLDLMLKGAGFFVLRDQDGNIRYSRDGRFDVKDGDLVASDLESKVMTQDATGQLVPINLNALKVSLPKATSEVTFDQNLSSDSSDDTLDSVVVIDKAGGKHTLQVVFKKVGDPVTGNVPGNVNWKVTVLEGTTEIGSTNLQFQNSQLPSGTSIPKLTLALKGVDPAEVTFNFSAVTGFPTGATSTLRFSKQDGFVAGTISTASFDAKGVLKITYSNGQTVDGPKLVLAELGDDNGLVAEGNGLFSYQGSVPVNLRAAGDDLKVVSQSLENSNVDLTQEFGDLILMQRGYQASSQVLSTANDMVQELMDMRGRK